MLKGERGGLECHLLGGGVGVGGGCFVGFKVYGDFLEIPALLVSCLLIDLSATTNWLHLDRFGCFLQQRLVRFRFQVRAAWLGAAQ